MFANQGEHMLTSCLGLFSTQFEQMFGREGGEFGAV